MQSQHLCLHFANDISMEKFEFLYAFSFNDFVVCYGSVNRIGSLNKTLFDIIMEFYK